MAKKEKEIPYPLVSENGFSCRAPLAYMCVCCAGWLQSCPTLYSHVGCSPPGSSVHGISRQEYWSGLPWPSPGDLSNPGIELESLMSPTLAGRLFTTSTTWEAHEIIVLHAYSVPTTMVKLKPKAIFKLPCPLIHPPWYILQALWEKGNTKTRSSPDT